MHKKNNPSNPDNKFQEQIEISFLGFRVKCSSPTSKTIIVLLIILTFLLVLVVLLPKYTAIRWLIG
jgi:hypothetical protein